MVCLIISIMDIFATRLKGLRLERQLTLKQTAAELKISLPAYAHYEQGVREPAFEVFVRICDFFNVPADYLLGRVDEY